MSLSLAETVLTWGSLTVYGARDADLTLETLTGWEDWDTRSQEIPRPSSHGWFDAPAYVDGKTVTAGGLIAAGSERDARLALVTGGFVPHDLLADLTIDHGGVELTASARLRRLSVTDVAWGVGVFRWTAQWTCPDGVRYGPWSSASTGFPTATGGLVYPLYPDGVMDYGTPSDSGRITVSNPGTAPAYPQFTIAGPVGSAGFEIVEVGSDRRMRFETAVPAGSSLLIDPALGVVLIDGVADRATYLTRQTIGAVSPGGSVEYAFLPLATTSAAQMTAAIRPAYW